MMRKEAERSVKRREASIKGGETYLVVTCHLNTSLALV